MLDAWVSIDAVDAVALPDVPVGDAFADPDKGLVLVTSHMGQKFEVQLERAFYSDAIVAEQDFERLGLRLTHIVFEVQPSTILTSRPDWQLGDLVFCGAWKGILGQAGGRKNPLGLTTEKPPRLPDLAAPNWRMVQELPTGERRVLFVRVTVG